MLTFRALALRSDEGLKKSSIWSPNKTSATYDVIGGKLKRNKIVIRKNAGKDRTGINVTKKRTGNEKFVYTRGL